MPHIQVPTNQVPGPLSWGLKRLTSGGRLDVTHWHDYRYDDNACGEGVTIYIMDDPVLMTHEEFLAPGGQKSRVRLLKHTNVEPDDSHGTFTAGIAAGTTCGVAKKASIVWVPVGDLADQILEDQKHMGNRACPAVVNISNTYIPNIIDPETTHGLVKLIRAGIHVVIAAGNHHQPIPAPWKDPAAQGEDNDLLKSVFWVGASESSDTKWFGGFEDCYASSFGPIVDLFAPGHNIRSATLESDKPNEGSVNKFYATHNGTSFAAPHVTGIIACLLSHPSYRNLSPKEMKEKILAMAEDAVTGVSLQNLLSRRTKSSFVKTILGDALVGVIDRKAECLRNIRQFNLHEEFTEEARKKMDPDYIKTLLPLLEPIKDTFDGSESDKFVQVYNDISHMIMQSLKMGWLSSETKLHDAKSTVLHRLYILIKKKHELLEENKFNLHAMFKAKALEMVKKTYINEHLLPVLDSGIQAIKNGLATFDQVKTRVVAEIKRSLKDEHIEESRVFTTTEKLASCRLDRWGRGTRGMRG